jgi:hypothetical protein
MTETLQSIVELPHDELEQVIPDDGETIRRIAYELWRSRGCPIGTAAIDWYAAEQQIKDRQASA